MIAMCMIVCRLRAVSAFSSSTQSISPFVRSLSRIYRYSSRNDDLPIVDAAIVNERALVPPPDRRKVVWKAAASSSVRVQEAKRTVEQYMALPASQYSVLTAEQITRLSDNEFKCTLGSLPFFGTKLIPVLYVTVDVFPEQAKSEIRVTRAEIQGDDAAVAINGYFSITAVNTVTAQRESHGKRRASLHSSTVLEIEAYPPATSRLPLGLIEKGGSLVLQSSLSLIVPTFVRILSSDFKRWSAGDDQREAVKGATLHVS